MKCVGGVAILVASLFISSNGYAQKKVVTTPKAAQSKLAVFDFMGETTEGISSRTTLNSSTCTSSENGTTDCTDMSDPAIAGRKLRWLSMEYFNQKLYRVYGNFGKYAFGELLSAFTAKYGAPKLETRKWQNKAGGVFDNSVAVWKFKGGELELESMGLDINTGQFEFISKPNSPPPKAPKVDF